MLCRNAVRPRHAIVNLILIPQCDLLRFPVEEDCLLHSLDSVDLSNRISVFAYIVNRCVGRHTAHSEYTCNLRSSTLRERLPITILSKFNAYPSSFDGTFCLPPFRTYKYLPLPSSWLRPAGKAPWPSRVPVDPPSRISQLILVLPKTDVNSTGKCETLWDHNNQGPGPDHGFRFSLYDLFNSTLQYSQDRKPHPFETETVSRVNGSGRQRSRWTLGNGNARAPSCHSKHSA